MMRRQALIWGISAGLFFTLACLPGAATVSPEAGEASPTSVPVIANPSESETATQPVATETPDEMPPAQDSGLAELLATRSTPPDPMPWLVFSAATASGELETLWAVKAHGVGVKKLTDDWVRVFSIQPQAADGVTHVAYVASAPLSLKVTDLTLKMVSLPDRQIETITPLASPDAAYPDQDNVATAIMFPGSVAWSPDGRWIAFVGAMDGPSADVYSYEIATGEIRQLTSGADQAYQLLWSPDSRWILHIAQEIFARSGGVFEQALGIWAAAPDGSAVNTLEGPRASEFLGWADANTLVVEGGPRMGPGGDLREINVATGSITELEPPCYDGIAYDLRQRVYLVQLSNIWQDPSCSGMDDWEPGLYLVKDGSRTLIPDLDVYDLSWSPVFDMFFARKTDDSLVAISPSGEVLTDFAGKVPSRSITASPDGSLLAWFEDTSLFVAVGPDYQPVRVPGDYYSQSKVLAWSK